MRAIENPHSDCEAVRRDVLRDLRICGWSRARNSCRHLITVANAPVRMTVAMASKMKSGDSTRVCCLECLSVATGGAKHHQFAGVRLAEERA